MGRLKRVAATAAAVVLVGSGSLSMTADAQTGAGASREHNHRPDHARGRFHDARLDAGLAALRARSASSGRSDAARAVVLGRTLGGLGVVDLDPLTGTPRQVARLDGFLSGPSSAPATEVALDYIAANGATFGLDQQAMQGLTLRRDYVDIGGTRHLSWVQEVDGVPVFGNGLEAHVTSDGRLIAVQGSPLPTLPARAGVPQTVAATARARAAADVNSKLAPGDARSHADRRRSTEWSNGDRASLVLFQTAAGLRLAWQTYVKTAASEAYTHVVDDGTGEVLYRHSHAAHASGDALVFQNYPGAPRGGHQKPVDFVANGWLAPDARTMSGPYAHAFADVDFDGVPGPDEHVAPTRGTKPRYPFVPFSSDPRCDESFWCSWDPNTANSWRRNRDQAVTQAFHHVNTFHDYLLAAPIGFTPAAGNFEAAGGDAVQVHALLGAALGSQAPLNNAFMVIPPDGVAPDMGLYLFGAPSLPGHAGDEADIVFHEYTHGLSWRLVVDASGNSTLPGGHQAGAMGEGWSDWYALDFLVGQGLEVDTAAPGELLVGKYLNHDQLSLGRTEGLDCALGVASARCPGTPGAGPGGYTYGDLGKVVGYPEEHADGEIFAQTLWDLRTAVGTNVARSIVTRAMELSPDAPSFLDMRNAIVQADVVNHGGAHVDAIWQVFAARGMGYFAGSIGAPDTRPVEDFSVPPAPGTPTATLTGTVTDRLTGQPVAGAVVGVAGLDSGFAPDHAAVTDGAGAYTIPDVLVGTYPKVFVDLAGWDVASAAVTVAAPSTVHNLSIRRNWAAADGGAVVTATNGDQYDFLGCGARAVIDRAQGTSWSPDVELGPNGAAAPKFVVVALPTTVHVTSVEIDPTAACFNDLTSSVGPYRVETSSDGTTWALAASGAFGPADTGRFNVVALAPGTARDVRFVRITLLGPQIDLKSQCATPQGTGCFFMDMAEFALYGVPSVPHP